jgi:Clostripain family
VANTENESAGTGRTPEWTVMVYMAAGQSHELDTVAVRDLKEMERGIRGNENVNVVVQINRHWPQSAQRYRIKDPNTGSELLKQLKGPTDMGAAETLTTFLTDVVRDPSFAAQHFCLVLWGHAYGLGFGRDHNNPLHLMELQAALAAFRTARFESGQGNTALEILGANACAMSYIEALYQLREVVGFMVTSQITVPFAGWPYDAILGRIARNTTPDALACQIVDAYVSQFDDLPDGSRLEMSAFNLAHAGKLNTEVEALAKAIDSDIRAARFKSAKMSFYRDVFMGATGGDVRPLIDARRLCDGLADADTESAPPEVQDAARKFRDILQPKCPELSAALIEHHSHHPTLDDLNGLGIFAPFVTDDDVSARLELNDLDADRMVVIGRKNKGRELYRSLDLFKVSEGGGTWPTLVFDTLRRTIPAELMAAIDGVTEMRRGDRADVAQIIMAIESSLNQLDRASAAASRGIVSMLEPDDAKLQKAIEPVLQKRSDPKTAYAGAGDEVYVGRETRENGGQSPSFGRPWLQLIPPVKREKGAVAPSVKTSDASVDRHLVSASVENLKRVERALSEVERTAKRGFTHARFGLGLINPGKPGLGVEPPKSGGGPEPPKSGGGPEPPKSGGGAPAGDRNGIASGDLRSDLALARVADLFGNVGECLRQLEEALTNVEVVTRAMLVPSASDLAVPDTSDGKAQEIKGAFDLLQEASAFARRIVRYVLSHPVYGLGPAEGELTFDVRQELARAGGLNKRQLRLL